MRANVTPQFILSRPYRIWYRANEMAESAHNFGTASANILLTLVYFTVLLPFGLTTRLFSDLLRTSKRPNTWLDYSPPANKGSDARDRR